MRITLLLVCTLGVTAASLAAEIPIGRSLGLPRIGGKGAQLDKDAYTVLDLVDGPGNAKKKTRNGHDYIEIAADESWTAPLRGTGQSSFFLSFQLYASSQTMVEAAGARLGVVATGSSRALQLMYDDPSGGWKELNVQIPVCAYGGVELAPAPVITLFVEPGAGVWSLYLDTKMVAPHLPLVGAPQRRLKLTGGKGAAWLGAGVVSDENPLFEDTNRNGIDDLFEKNATGGLLRPDAPTATRFALFQAWAAYQRKVSPPAITVGRFRPDKAG